MTESPCRYSCLFGHPAGDQYLLRKVHGRVFSELNLWVSFWERQERGLKECTPLLRVASSELPKEAFTLLPARATMVDMAWTRQKCTEWLERTLAGLDSIVERRGRAAAEPAHLLVGIKGEEAALFYLLGKGYTVVARRWSAGNLPGDLDLVAWQGPVLCFVEVKTRTARDRTPAEAAVDSHKRHMLRRLARRYLRQLPGGSGEQVRFDVVSVYIERGKALDFVHFEDAFGWREKRPGERI
ncbi:MAG: YraN family protein [Terracidiphilus sp.]